MTSARPKMRTMPSATLVTAPSLRASAARPTFSMRVLISSLISDGLSVVVAIASFLRCAPRGARMNSGCLLVLFRERGLQARELALQDRQSVVYGKSGSVRVDIGGRRT